MDFGSTFTKAVERDPEDGALRREVVAMLPVSRTVEGDLGLRWNAPGIVHAAVKESLLPVEEQELLYAEATRPVPSWSPVPPVRWSSGVARTLPVAAATLASRVVDTV